MQQVEPSAGIDAVPITSSQTDRSAAWVFLGLAWALVIVHLMLQDAVHWHHRADEHAPYTSAYVGGKTYSDPASLTRLFPDPLPHVGQALSILAWVGLVPALLWTVTLVRRRPRLLGVLMFSLALLAGLVLAISYVHVY